MCIFDMKFVQGLITERGVDDTNFDDIFLKHLLFIVIDNRSNKIVIVVFVYIMLSE